MEEGCLLSYSFPDFVVRMGAEAAPMNDLVSSGTPLSRADSTKHDPSWEHRFERMRREFLTWEGEALNAWEGRTGEVVTGCFAGARNAELVEALRVVYCQNAVLRSAGDLVFRMMRPPSSRRA